MRAVPENDGMDATTTTILGAASSILRDEGLQRVRDARSTEERECANAALLASVTIERFLQQVDALDRPF